MQARILESNGMRRILPALVVLATGCVGERTGGAGPIVRDSAGVVIVENTVGAWSEGASWRLSDVPLVDIGVLEGDPSYQLFQVAGALRLTDGRIVVANRGTNELRFYDAVGVYLGASGRKGGGPGEFENLSWLGRLGSDSLLAYDSRHFRVSMFDSAGRFVRSFALPQVEARGFPTPLGLFSDGSLLVVSWRVFSTTMDLRTGVYRDSVPYFRYGVEGALIDTLGSFPSGEYYLKVRGGGFSVNVLPFARWPRAVVHGDRLFLGTGERYEVVLYAADGSLERLIRKAHANLRVTQEDIAAYKQEQLERARDENWRREQEALLAEIPFPETMPAYSRLLVDEEGHLWVEDYRRPGDEEPRWSVFDPNGRLLGTVPMPPKFGPVQIGGDFVLGRWVDDFEVEHVRLYALLKP